MQCLRRSNTVGMGSNSCILLLLFALLLCPAPIGAAGGFRLCGLKLTMTLNSICKSQLCGGYILGMAKRKSPDLESPPDPAADEESNAPPTEEELRTFWAMEEQPKQSRTKRSYPYGMFGLVKKSGIATECCSKRCTLSYLRTYCCAAPAFTENQEKETADKQQDEDGDS